MRETCSIKRACARERLSICDAGGKATGNKAENRAKIADIRIGWSLCVGTATQRRNRMQAELI
jgi:hypothetical protein